MLITQRINASQNVLAGILQTTGPDNAKLIAVIGSLTATKCRKPVQPRARRVLFQTKRLTLASADVLKTTGGWIPTKAVSSSVLSAFLLITRHPSAYQNVLPIILMLTH